MKAVRFIMPPIGLLLIALLTQGCVLQNSVEDLTKIGLVENKISGSFSILQGMSISQNVSAASCTSYQAHLYKVTASGSLINPALQTVYLDSNGNYSFNGVSSLNISLQDPDSLKNYLVVVSGCGETYRRILTSSRDQNVSPATDVLSLSYSLLNKHGVFVNSLTQNGIKSVNQKAEQLSAMDRYDAYVALKNNAQTSTQFLTTFGFSIEELGHMPPQISIAGDPSTMTEGTLLSLNVTQDHWNTDYVPEVQWLLDASTVSTAEDLSYTPGKNIQGSRTLRLRVGKQASAGVMDVTRPIYEKVWNISIGNAYPAISPALSLAGPTFTNSPTVTLNINTGSAFQNCETFSNMLFTESSFVAPITWTGSFNCTASPSQAQNFSLSVGDGAKTIALWTLDSAGNISVSPTYVNLTLDTQGPALTLNNLTGGQTIAGGSPYDILYSASDDNLAANPISIYVSSDSGSSYVALASNLANTGVYSWLVPSTNSALYRVRIVATDKAGNQTLVASASNFTISNSLPHLTQTMTPSIHKSNQSSLVVTYGGACENALPIDLTIDGTPAAPITCTSSAWTYTTTAMNSDGTRVYVFSQNNGLITSIQATLIRDTQIPSISNLVVANGVASTSSRFLDLQFSTSDSAGTVQSKVSHICPKTYLSSGSVPTAPVSANDLCWISLANSGISLATTYTNTTISNYYFNAFITDNHTVRAWVQDEAGNISTSYAEDGLLFNNPVATTLINLTASNSDASPLPLPRADLDVPLNQPVYIKWKTVSGTTPITSDSIRIFYNSSTLETASNWIEADTGTIKQNAANNGCTINSNYTGCYTWYNTVGNTPLRFKVQVNDSSNVTSAGETNRINTGVYNVLVGNMSVGIGGVGSQFSFFDNSQSTNKIIAVSDDGIVYSIIKGVGLIRILPSTSQVELLVPETGVDTNGPIGTATMGTVNYSWMYLDGSGRLYFSLMSGGNYVWSGNKVRRFNPASNTVELILNNNTDGTSRTDGTLGINFKTGSGSLSFASIPNVAPNGDMYFADTTVNAKPVNVKLWKYTAATGVVSSIPMPNLASLNSYAQPNNNWGTGRDASNYNINQAFWIFNSDSTVKSFILHTGSGDNAIPSPTPVYDGNYQILPQAQSYNFGTFIRALIQGRDLKIYRVSSSWEIAEVSMLNMAASPTIRLRKANDFLPDDGASATTASSGKAGAYDITSSGRIYFVEKGLLRFIDESGLIRTYAGQAANGGDGLNSINVRLGGIDGVFKSNNGFLIMEVSERILEHKFADSKIYARAGNGQSRTTSLAQNAKQTGMSVSWSGGSYISNMAYDSVTDSIYLSTNVLEHTRMTAVHISSTGVITPVVGGAVQNTANAFPNVADGFLGANITTTGSLDGAAMTAGVLSFDPDARKLLVGMTTARETPLETRHAMLKHYDLADQKIYHYSGVNSGPGPTYTLGINTTDFSVDGTTIANAETPRGGVSYRPISVQYDGDNPILNGGPRYITIAKGPNRMVSLPVDNSKSIQTMAAPFVSSWAAFARKSGNSYVYICTGAGLLRRAPLPAESPATNLVFTTLDLPSGVTCTGGTTNNNGNMYYDQDRQAIIFPIRQNYSFGIAEYYDP